MQPMITIEEVQQDFNAVGGLLLDIVALETDFMIRG